MNSTKSNLLCVLRFQTVGGFSFQHLQKSGRDIWEIRRNRVKVELHQLSYVFTRKNLQIVNTKNELYYQVLSDFQTGFFFLVMQDSCLTLL